jgi:hypothetical protein
MMLRLEENRIDVAGVQYVAKLHRKIMFAHIYSIFTIVIQQSHSRRRISEDTELTIKGFHGKLWQKHCFKAFFIILPTENPIKKLYAEKISQRAHILSVSCFVCARKSYEGAFWAFYEIPITSTSKTTENYCSPSPRF